jgi:hypothetical protein
MSSIDTKRSFLTDFKKLDIFKNEVEKYMPVDIDIED